MNSYNLDITDLLVKNATVTKAKTIENSTLEYRYYVENGITWLLTVPMKNGVIDGQIRLFKNGIVTQLCYMVNGSLTGEYVWFHHGIVQRMQLWDNIISNNDKRYLVNKKERMEMVIEDCKTNHIIYRGEYNEKYYRYGYGCSYNAEDGKLAFYGRFENDKLVELHQSFNGKEMIEYARSDNPFIERHAIYIGEYIESEKQHQFLRHGNGCIIDPMNGIAIKECQWDNGKIIHSIDLVDGIYSPSEEPSVESVIEPVPIKPIQSVQSIQPIQPVHSVHSVHSVQPNQPVDLMDNTINVEISNEVDLSSSEYSVVSVNIQKGLDRSVITSSIQLQTLPATLEEFIVTSSICNDINVTELVLTDYAMLKSVVVGDHCFENVNKCILMNLPNILTIEIGKYSFTKMKDYHQLISLTQNTKTFTLSNCDKLQQLSFNQFAFADYCFCQLSSISPLFLLYH